MRTKRTLRKRTLSALKPIKRVSVSAWADKYRQLPADSAEPGQWRTARVEYMRAVMDAFTENEVHRVVVKCCAQAGKSESLLNVVARFVHLDPCAMMIIQPTLEMSQDFSRSRLSRMIADTKVLTPLFYSKAETILSKYFKGGRLVLAGANSPAGLASRPIRILLCDEVDRFPISASSEGDPVELAAKRTSTYWNYKIGLFSTPTAAGASRIEIEYLAGTQEEWNYRCPNCGEWHILDYRQMAAEYIEKVDEYKNRTVIVNAVKWQCPDCGFKFDELTMKGAEQKYIAKNPEALKNGVRSFWLNGFSSPWLSWERIMREYLEARGDAVREQVVFNTRFGEVYQLRGEYSDENEFLQRREEYAADIPAGVLVLTAGVDVQANRLEYEVVGWGVGYESWGVKRGVVQGSPNDLTTWQNLDRILDAEYKLPNGAALKVARTFIDSGYAAKVVYEYCRLNVKKGRFAIKGVGATGIPLIHKFSTPKGAGIILTMLGVNDGKQEVMSRLGISQGGAGYMHYPLNEGCGYDANYFKQLIAEHKVVRKSGGLIKVTWEPVSSHARNESLDVRVYALGALKSCVGKNEERFWREQAAALKAEPNEKAVRKVMTRALDIW